MDNIMSLRQLRNGNVRLSVIKNARRYHQELTPDEANQLAYKLMSFTAGQQDHTFYLLRNSNDPQTN